jgi:acyl-CoA hydrolase
MTDTAQPNGELTLRTLAMPGDANAAGDIFGGWVMAQMDLSAGIRAAESRSATRSASIPTSSESAARPSR